MWRPLQALRDWWKNSEPKVSLELSPREPHPLTEMLEHIRDEHAPNGLYASDREDNPWD